MYYGQTGATREYGRKILYLDYMENGTRVKCAGFVKVERWDGLCSISLQISGLYRRDHFTRPLLLLGQGGERELCRLSFADGGVKTRLDKLDIHDLDGQGLEYARTTGLRIPITEGKEILSIWRKESAAQEGEERAEPRRMEVSREEARGTEASENLRRPEVSEENEAEKRETAGREKVVEPDGVLLEGGETKGGEGVRGTEASEERRAEEELQRTEVSREKASGLDGALLEGGETKGREEARGTEASENPRESEPPDLPPVMLHEEKWEQLSEIYPHVYPFDDNREYLSMGPGDFVILSGRYYKLVSNSFLLHGYYNYNHLILARVEQRGAFRYYIGVPGNYYEREKRIAILFGFESFECNQEPAEEGDFGYYMIPVEL